MDYIELLEKYMQGLTTPEEEKALLDWIQHDGDARSTISAFYEKRCNEVCSCDIGYNGRFCIFCLLFLFLRK